MKINTKTKLLIFSFVSLCIFAVFWNYTEAFSITIERWDVQQWWEYVRDSQLFSSVKSTFSQAWSEVHHFIAKWLDDLVVGNSKLENTIQVEQVATLPTKPTILRYSSLTSKKYFSDVEHDINAEAIYLLAKYSIINSGVNNFYPKNYVRLHECVKMLLKGCEIQRWNSISSEKTTALSSAPEHYQLADKLWMLQWIANPTNFERLLTAKEYIVLLKNFSSLSDELRPYAEMQDILDEDWTTITRSEIAGRIIQLFHLSWNSRKKWVDVKTDKVLLDNPSYDFDIGTSSDVVDILISHAMYPFSEVKTWVVSRIGFAQFLAQVHANYYGNSLIVKSWKNIYSDISYVEQPYMYYLQKEDLINYLTEIKRGKAYFFPNKNITRHEVYYILSSAFSKIFNNVDTTDEQVIDYQKLSTLFVESIASRQKNNEDIYEINGENKKEMSILSEVFSLFTKWD